MKQPHVMEGKGLLFKIKNIDNLIATIDLNGLLSRSTQA